MRFAEQLLLLLHSQDTGYFVPIPEWRMSCALAGAVLMDLAMENRIDSDLETLTVVDTTPTGDGLLDPSLEDLASEEQVHPPQYWVERLARRGDQISDGAIERLVRKGIFESDDGGFWTLSKKVTRTGRYPLVDGWAGEEIKGRIFRTLLDKEFPDPRDIVIIGLVHYCDGFKAMMEPEEYEAAEELIELYSNMDLIGRAIGPAVRSSYRPPASMRGSRRRRAMPTVGLRGALASKSFRAGNLPRFFAETAQELGPVFEMRFPGRRLVVLAGVEVNRWMAKKGRLHLRTRDYLEDFQQEWGTARSIASMDGADHFRMRRVVRADNSRKVVEDRLDELLALCRGSFRSWGVRKVLPGEMTCQRLAGAQIARLSVSFDPPLDLLDDLLHFEYRALLVHGQGLLPKFTLRTPYMRRCKRRVLELYAMIHATHTEAQRAGKRRDLVDDLMELHHADPQFLPETDLGFAFIAPIIAGHYTGSAVAFSIYELLRHPDYREQIVAEADAMFADGDPTAADVTPEATDAARRFVMEVLRLHEVVPAHVRTAMNAFEIEGIEVPAYSRILVSFSAPHHMEEYFPEPEKFDIDRYLEPRNEHRLAGVYAPFGVGTHTCGGASWTRLQMVMNVLMLAHYLDLEMVPRDYRLRRNPLPKNSVNRKFRFRVTGHRHPLERGQ
ncbi:MAG: cytochrome P450 [Acidobacteriota bacterium]|nr:cytochrome P450 [Acidobacteriota bacterium]